MTFICYEDIHAVSTFKFHFTLRFVQLYADEKISFRQFSRAFRVSIKKIIPYVDVYMNINKILF